jgi:hypothetical protein
MVSKMELVVQPHESFYGESGSFAKDWLNAFYHGGKSEKLGP